MRVDQCQPASTAAGLADPAAAARTALASKPLRAQLEDEADKNLSLAESLWKQEQKLCSTGPAQNPNDQAIERVLARLSRQ